MLSTMVAARMVTGESAYLAMSLLVLEVEKEVQKPLSRSKAIMSGSWESSPICSSTTKVVVFMA